MKALLNLFRTRSVISDLKRANELRNDINSIAHIIKQLKQGKSLHTTSQYGGYPTILNSTSESGYREYNKRIRQALINAFQAEIDRATVEFNSLVQEPGRSTGKRKAAAK